MIVRFLCASKRKERTNRILKKNGVSYPLSLPQLCFVLMFDVCVLG
jgi:hypothetical protein